MRVIANLLLIFLLGITKTFATSITVSGNVTGQWNADTVFVTSDIQVPFNQSLTLKAGCKVLFKGYYGLKVYGQLTALGTEANPIHFKSADTTGFSEQSITGSWAGVFVQNAPWAPVIFQHCVFQYIKASPCINLEYGFAQFRNCQFYNNLGSYLLYNVHKSHVIRNCIMANNDTWYGVVHLSSPMKDTIKLENNTIVNNNGVAVYHTGYVRTVCLLRNNILWNNTGHNGEEIYYGPYHEYGFDSSYLILQNCIVKNGAKLPMYNSSCFEQYPLFKDTANRNFALEWQNFPVNDSTHSIGIDKGYFLSPRDPDSTLSDIGAIPFNRSNGTSFTWVSYSMDSVLGYQSNHVVRFTNLSNKPYATTAWLWDFGDGATSTASEPVHTYTKSGIFSVKLVATDPGGHKDSLVINNAITVMPGTRVNAGEVSGTWEKSNSPYYVYGNVYVPQDKKLEIREGVVVKFMGQYGLDVFGSIVAKGQLNDSIRFEANDTTKMRLYKGMNIDFPDADFQRSRGWRGIHVVSDKARTDTCIVEYCVISDVRIGRHNDNLFRGALQLHYVNTALVRNTLFRDNFTTPNFFISDIDTSAFNYQNAGISGVGTSAKIEGNRFENLYQFAPAAIYITRADSVRIANNTFFNIYGTAAAIEHVRSYQFLNNKLDSINGWGLRLDEEDPKGNREGFHVVDGNTFSNSVRGIRAGSQLRISGGVFQIKITNNIFRGLKAKIDVCLEAYGDRIYISNNLFYNNSVTYEISNVGATCINLLLKNTMTGVVANNTIVNNYGFAGFQPIIYADEAVRIYNNIVRNKSGVELQATHISNSGSSFFSTFKGAFNNNVKGGYAGGGQNYDDDPEFVDTLNADFRLKKTSRSINRGYADTAKLFLPAKDFYGNPRVDPYLGKIDVGISEYITQQPTELRLSNDTIQENKPAMTAIGKLSTIDPDAGDFHTYALVSIPNVSDNNAEFKVVDDVLYSNAVFQGTQEMKKVSIRSKDQFGAYVDSSFVIKVKANVLTSIPTVNALSSQVMVYPNPVKTDLYVDLLQQFQGRWRIYSLDGRLLMEGDLKSKTKIDVSSLSKGSYLLKVESKKINGSFVVLKQ